MYLNYKLISYPFDEAASCTTSKKLITLKLVTHSQTFRLMAEGLDSIAAFIGQGRSD